MLSSLLQNTSPLSDNSEKSKEDSGAAWGGAPFFLRKLNKSGYQGKAIIFPTKSPYHFAGKSNMMYVGIFGPNTNSASTLEDAGELRLAVISDDQPVYANIWPPLSADDESTEGSLKYMKKKTEDELLNFRNAKENENASKYRFILLKNVVDFDFVVHKLQKSDNTLAVIPETDYADRLKRPAAIEFQISVLNEDDYIRYKEMIAAGNANAENFRQENQHTFNRYIFLNSRPE